MPVFSPKVLRRVDGGFMERSEQAKPKAELNVWDAVAIIAGIVIGAGIFRTPQLVGVNTHSEAQFVLAWLLGGMLSAVGALCYAELATAYPHAGGEYVYLTRAFGKAVGFLFAWARLAVIQTGSIAGLSYIFGDYASKVFSLGYVSSAFYASLAVVILTALNIIGVREGKWTQNVLTTAKVLGLIAVFAIGVFGVASPSSAVNHQPSAISHQPSAFGLAMIFVLYAYGGWNEAAYIAAELKAVWRNMLRALLLGIGLVSLVYLLVNVAYLRGLGFDGVRQSATVAADLLSKALGDSGARAISVLIAISALGATNGTIFTGARTSYAMGSDHPLFGFLGHWHQRFGTPANALALQGGVSLALVWSVPVLMGFWAKESLAARSSTLWTEEGFKKMVEYTAPVFWLFFLLTGIALFVLREKEPSLERPFRVPLYPLTPIIFCSSCAFMLYSSLAYVKFYALLGVAVLLVGVPLYICSQLKLKQQSKVRQEKGEI